MEERYCHECGSPLTPGATFCPSCGAVVNSENIPDTNATASVASATVNQTQRTNNRKSTVILCLAWGIIAVVFGAYLYVCSDSMVNELINQLESMEYSSTQTYWDYMVENGLDRNVFVSMYELLGITLAISGIMALVSAHFTYRGIHYKLALLTLILSSIFAAMSIITLVIGLIVTYMLTKRRNEFVS